MQNEEAPIPYLRDNDTGRVSVSTESKCYELESCYPRTVKTYRENINTLSKLDKYLVHPLFRNSK